MTFVTVDADRPLRGVLVGAGFIGRQWAPELLAHPGTRLVGWVDVRPERAARRPARWGGRTYPSARR